MTARRQKKAAGEHGPPGNMEFDGGGEIAGALIAGLQVRNRPVTRTQLSRWHRAGYLPTPRRVPLGRGLGTISIYPLGTRKQLEALCQLLSRDRNLTRVGWCMWWDGYAVPHQLARDLLTPVADDWEQLVDQLRSSSVADPSDEASGEELDSPDEVGEDLNLGLSDEAWQALDNAPQVRLRRAWVRRVRKRIGSQRFPTFMRIVMQVMAGSFTHFAFSGDSTKSGKKARDVSDKSVLAKALGLDQVERLMPEVDIAEASPNLEALASAFSAITLSARPRQIAAEITNSELHQARRELQTLEAAALALEDVITTWIGLHQSAILREPARLLSVTRPEDWAAAVLLWQAARTCGYGPAIDAFVVTAQQIVVAQQMAQSIQVHEHEHHEQGKREHISDELARTSSTDTSEGVTSGDLVDLDHTVDRRDEDTREKEEERGIL